MSAFWEGVGTGIGTSAVVATVVYFMQKRDAKKESKEMMELMQNSFAHTVAIIEDSTDRVHAAVVRNQLEASRNRSNETLLNRHIEIAINYLNDLNSIESLKISQLHKNIFSDEAIYAGILRDVEAVVSPCGHKDINLVPVKVCDIHRRLEEWERSLQDLLLQEMHMSVGEKFERAARLHADFLKIHPFFDGNGLTSRALFGALSQRLLGKILFIPRADQKYISTLRLAIAGDIEPFKAYLLTCASEGNS